MGQLAFAVLSAVMLGAGALAVTTRNLVHSVLWLAIALVSTSGIYALLDASFLAAIQIILYTGGVITLMLFGVMLTDQGAGPGATNESHRRPIAALMSAAMFALLGVAIWRGAPTEAAESVRVGAREIGRSFLTQHLLAFEALSILLLAAMLGAIIIARRKDP
jgi:NADH-quinone oxidoreductase subunit J